MTTLTMRMILAVLTVAGVVAGCSDMGEDPGGGELRASAVTVSVNAGGRAEVTISGGEPPYVITDAPDTALASAAFVNPAVSPATLVITAPATVNIGGTTRVRIGDVHAAEGATDAPLHEEDLTIMITVSPAPALTAVPVSVAVGSAQAANVVISGGTPPYVIVEPPADTLATAAFVDGGVTPATLVITGVSNASVSGSTSVKVKDSRPSPQAEVRIPITKNP